MFGKLFLAVSGIIIGLFIGYAITIYLPQYFLPDNILYNVEHNQTINSRQVIGFLPYWLVNKAQADYSRYITQLAYFSLTIDTDGSIVKMTNPQETDPGWNALNSGKMDAFFSTAREHNVALSLVVASGNNDAINTMISDPKNTANKLLSDITPIMRKYGFSDLNLDVESTTKASDSARNNFAIFARTVKNGLNANKIGTLTIDISPTDLIKKDLIDPESIKSIADYVLVMGYDYHYIGSYVTGPVAPLYGAGTESEYDVNTAIQQALRVYPSNQIILGLPLYGYEWETIGDTPRSAVLPDSGLTASTERIATLISSCATCSAKLDEVGEEEYLIYKDADTGTYHQIFYPDENAMNVKVNYAANNQLGGLALWALGYENPSLLTPLIKYKE